MQTKALALYKFWSSFRGLLIPLMLLFICCISFGGKCENADPAYPRIKSYFKRTHQKKTHSISAPASTLYNYDSLFTLLLPIQDSIYANSSSIGTIVHLLASSLDTVSGCFFLVGKGVVNKEQPENAREQGRQLAAAYDGKRWALYCKAWYLDRKIKFGHKISGEILYSKIVLQHTQGDTLFTLVQIPMGSIVLK